VKKIPKAKLENWSVIAGNVAPYTAPELLKSRLGGEVSNHPLKSDGQAVLTSNLISLNTRTRRAITNSRAYDLGEPCKEWLKYLEENNYKLSDFDKRG